MRAAWPALALAALLAAGCGGGAEAPQAAEQATQEQPRTSVRVASVEARTLQAWVYGQGTARSRQREFLTFTQAGMVTHVDPALRVGSPVRPGQLIAHQAPGRVRAELQAAEAALAEAEAKLALARVTERRYRTLVDQQSASQQELDEAEVGVQQAVAARGRVRAELEQARLGLQESRLVAPIHGVLARLNVERGRYFLPSTVQTDSEQNALRTVPALVIDPHRFEVRVELPAYLFRELATGARAVVDGDPPADPQHADPAARAAGVAGRVHAVSPSLNPATRTFEVVVHTAGREHGLQDGQFVAVWIAAPAQGAQPAVPLDALRHRDDQSFVFVADPQAGRVAERRVELGRQSGGWRAVLDGLQPGELVVTEGRAALRDGQPVRILAPAGGP